MTAVKSQYDVVIVGGGMVGASLAIGFAKQCRSVLLLEAHEPQSEWLSQPPLRVSAINRNSESWLSSLGMWQAINEPHRCQFNRLATWEEGSARVEFSAEEISETHLGHLVRNEAIQLAAFDTIKNSDELAQLIDVVFEDALDKVSQSESTVTLTLASTQQLTASLLIGADGARSQVRALANIGSTGWDYQQQCFSITVKTDFPTQDITWQEFQPSGPKAFLPLNDGYACFIWYDSKETVSRLKLLTNEQLKLEIKKTYHSLPGDFDVVRTASFPLRRSQANQYVKNRIVLVGDSAHTINPLAGQGVNLGFKDNERLLTELSGIDLADPADTQQLNQGLAKYARLQKIESAIMSSAMDSFYQLFSNQKTPLKFARKCLLNMTNKLPAIKKEVMKKALGF